MWKFKVQLLHMQDTLYPKVHPFFLDKAQCLHITNFAQNLSKPKREGGRERGSRARGGGREGGRMKWSKERSRRVALVTPGGGLVSGEVAHHWFSLKHRATHAHWLLAVRIQGEVCFYVPILFTQLLKYGLDSISESLIFTIFLGGGGDPTKLCSLSFVANSLPLETTQLLFRSCPWVGTYM